MWGTFYLFTVDLWGLGSLYDGQLHYSQLNNPHHLSPFLKQRLDSLLWLCVRISFSPNPFNCLADFLSRQSLWLSSCIAEGNHKVSKATAITPTQWEQAHEGHFGVLKTFLRLRDMGLHPSFTWVQKRIRECFPCQSFHCQ